jgi:uncharacterized protein (TIGR03000 family)
VQIMRATFLSFALAAALIFAGGNQAMAQHGHGGGHGAAHVGGHAGGAVVVGHGGGAWAGYGHYGYPYAYYNHNHGYGWWPYAGAGFALGYALGAGTGYGYAPAYGYAYPGYGYASPGYYDVVPSAYAAPAYTAPTNAQQPVMMTVMVPKGDAEVFINDTATTTTGTERQFESPALDPGQNYHYTIRAQWMENGKRVEQKREVPVKAGQSVTVDFTKPAREVVAPPQPK